jgi:Arc/MetJ-type ribon-helix-helix transcriptional regulator
MPTTVHLPDDLLRKVDERARALNIPRNRYIVEALRKVLADQTSWSPAFLDKLERLSPVEGVDELLEAVRTRRTRKAPPRF